MFSTIMNSLLVAHQSFGNFSVFPIRFYYDFWPLKAVMSDCCDLKCDWEFSKINDSHFQHLGVIKIAKSSSNLALYFRMRFLILVHCERIPFLKESATSSIKTGPAEGRKIWGCQ